MPVRVGSVRPAGPECAALPSHPVDCAARPRAEACPMELQQAPTRPRACVDSGGPAATATAASRFDLQVAGVRRGRADTELSRSLHRGLLSRRRQGSRDHLFGRGQGRGLHGPEAGGNVRRDRRNRSRPALRRRGGDRTLHGRLPDGGAIRRPSACAAVGGARNSSACHPGSAAIVRARARVQHARGSEPNPRRAASFGCRCPVRRPGKRCCPRPLPSPTLPTGSARIARLSLGS